MIPQNLCLLSLVLVVSAQSIPSDHQLVFDENDPFTSHPAIQEAITEIFDRQIRRGLTLPNQLDDTDRQKIIEVHNKIRLETAKGKFVGPTPHYQACNMKKLKWSKALEQMASEWASGCPKRVEGDPGYVEGGSPHSSNDWGLEFMKKLFNNNPGLFEWKYDPKNPPRSYGENIHSNTGVPNIDVIIGYLYKGGWGQREAKQSVWKEMKWNVVGHYTQVVWANTEWVGCGFKYCEEQQYKTQFVCNYHEGGNLVKHGRTIEDPYEVGGPGTCCADGFVNDDGLCVRVEGKSKTVGGSASSSSVSMHSPPKKKETKSVVSEVKSKDKISVYRDIEPRKVRYGERSHGPPVGVKTKKREPLVDKSEDLMASVAKKRTQSSVDKSKPLLSASTKEKIKKRKQPPVGLKTKKGESSVDTSTPLLSASTAKKMARSERKKRKKVVTKKKSKDDTTSGMATYTVRRTKPKSDRHRRLDELGAPPEGWKDVSGIGEFDNPIRKGGGHSSHLGLDDVFASEQEVANVNDDGYVWMRMNQRRNAQIVEVVQWSYVALAFIVLIALGVCFVFGAAFVGCLGFGVYYKHIAKTEHSFDFV